MAYDVSKYLADIRLLTLDTDATSGYVYSDAQVVQVLNLYYTNWRATRTRFFPSTGNTVSPANPTLDPGNEMEEFSLSGNIKRVRFIRVTSAGGDVSFFPPRDFNPVLERRRNETSNGSAFDEFGMGIVSHNETAMVVVVTAAPRIADAATVAFVVEKNPTPLDSTTPTQEMDLAPDDQRIVVALCAAHFARMLGLPPDHVGGIAAFAGLSPEQFKKLDMSLEPSKQGSEVRRA